MTIKSHTAFLVFGAAVGFAAGFKAGEAVYADEKEKETMKKRATLMTGFLITVGAAGMAMGVMVRG